jgi:hypothetical protein
MLRDLSALRWLEAGESVILYGPSESGNPMSPKHSDTKWLDAAATARFHHGDLVYGLGALTDPSPTP